MPIYEYKCIDCGDEFEKLFFTSSASKDISCEKCGSERVERKVSAISSCGNSTTSSFGGCGSGGFS